MSIFVVVGTNTGRFYGAFTQHEYAMQSIKISYSRMADCTISILHSDVWNTDLEIGLERITIKRVEPKDFAEHL